jgi:hypothetical protein
MLEIAYKLTNGLASAYRSPIPFKHAVEIEWRAAQVAARDRAHLATIGGHPLHGCHPSHPDRASGRQAATCGRPSVG